MNTLTTSTIIVALIKAAAAHTGIPAARIHLDRSTEKENWPAIQARASIMLALREQCGMSVHTITRAFNQDDPAVRTAIVKARSRIDRPEHAALAAALKDAIDTTLVGAP